MTFDEYFQQCEESYENEKMELLKRADDITEKWRHLARLDNQSAKLVLELTALKNLLRRGHLQILRVKEESLNHKLINSQLAFRVRQLQNEIKRFLPYTTCHVPSTEYIVAIDSDNYEKFKKTKGNTTTISADNKLKEDFESILKQWKDLSEVQEKAFKEENELYVKDNEQFSAFKKDCIEHNRQSRKILDEVHSAIISDLLRLQKYINTLIKSSQDEINNSQSDIKYLEVESNNTNKKSTRKPGVSKSDLHSKMTDINESINKRIEEQKDLNDLKKIEARRMREMFEDEIAKCSERISKLKKRDKSLLDKSFVYEFIRSKSTIDKLEGEMNALVTSATAVKENYEDTTLAVIGALTGAVDEYARAANDAEKTCLKMKNVSERLNNMYKQITETYTE